MRLRPDNALQISMLARQGATIAIAMLLAKSSVGQENIGAYEALQFLNLVLVGFWISGLTQGMLSAIGKWPKEKYGIFFF